MISTAYFSFFIVLDSMDHVCPLLSVIRKRLNLPALAPGSEPAPGAYGLGTPGYYLIGLHFRAMPLGFEPYSIHGATAEATASRRQQVWDLESCSGNRRHSFFEQSHFSIFPGAYSVVGWFGMFYETPRNSIIRLFAVCVTAVSIFPFEFHRCIRLRARSDRVVL